MIDELVAAAKSGLVATTGPRYFGFVIGGALPAATAADVLDRRLGPTRVQRRCRTGRGQSPRRSRAAG